MWICEKKIIMSLFKHRIIIKPIQRKIPNKWSIKNYLWDLMILPMMYSNVCVEEILNSINQPIWIGKNRLKCFDGNGLFFWNGTDSFILFQVLILFHKITAFHNNYTFSVFRSNSKIEESKWIFGKEKHLDFLFNLDWVFLNFVSYDRPEPEN